MQLMNLVLLLGIFLFCHLFYRLYHAWTDQLRDVPGPFWTRYTRLWYLKHVINGRFHEESLELHRKFAKPGEHHARIVRLAPNLYSVASPEKEAYGIASTMPKGAWYNGWVIPNTATGLFQERNMEIHAKNRRKLSAMYSVSSLISYEPSVGRLLDQFQTRLSELAHDGETFDMAQWLQFWAFDVIGEMTFSKPFGFLDQGHDVNVMCEAVDQSTVYSTLVGIYHRVHNGLFRILSNLPGGASGTTYIINMASAAIRERLLKRKKGTERTSRDSQIENGPTDFLDRIMDLVDKRTTAASEPDIGTATTASLQNLFAGSDTTAVSSSSVLYYLIRNPRALRNLREEVATCSSDGRLTFQVAQNLPYLQVPKGGASIYGRVFPAGAVVGINAWVPHYDCDIWGPDASEFRPERWSEAENTPQLKRMNAYYMPFGLGSRTCIGKNVSLLEMSKLIPRLVMVYDFELERDGPWTTKNLWFVKPLDFKVKVKHRKAVNYLGSL
ncbi:cytochrome P450 [Ophiobolus disseminans]|uniref:Cytochrome P450 n=1 Tax=Ophiobolus disseminans TaxID=1469910 RepID=A0A6A6ZTD7_9PLEO|nr:cytochrome P450 [Ophiobolus disseminans]